ncbi:hypothetical protein JW859_10965 [bacterium]|nr:hypothetical protein [bacterium]
MAPVPHDAPDEIKQLISEFFDDDDIGGVWVSEDRTRVAVNVYIDGSVSTQTYVMDEKTGRFHLIGYTGQRMSKTDIG